MANGTASTKRSPQGGLPVEEPATERVVKLLSAQYFEVGKNALDEKVVRVKTARRGEIILVGPAEEARLEALGALLEPGQDPGDAERIQSAKLDAYRAERGDQEALQRHAARLAQAQPEQADDGGIVRVDAPVDAGAGELAAWIKESEPSSDETVALAEGDPDRARVVLEAEETATGGSPRPEVREGLEQIIAG